MKFSTLISVLFICLFFAACASDEEDACITAFDCPDGYSCVDSVCRPPVADGDTAQEGDTEPQDVSDSSELPSGGDSGDELPDGTSLPGENDGNAEIPDDITGCPNACSGFGECNFETGICTCTGNHGGEDCSECAEGYHLEAVDDDEDGDGAVSCAPNVTCSSNPCHGNGCREEGDTVKCTCNATNHQGGRWCEGCADGYLLNNAGVCKEDCSLKTCTYPQKCGVDPASNEASCGECENEFYTGANCTSCDTEHFCNGHATACAVENGAEKCTCEAAYAGATCNTCASGYFQSNGACIKSCDTNKCFKTHSCTGDYLTYTLEGHGTCSNTTGECICDPGWLTGTSNLGTGTSVTCGIALAPVETLNNVECTICDKNNPPSNYSSTGCPLSATGSSTYCFCDTGILFSTGTCYYEPTGDHKLYCVCNSGYHLEGDKYTGSCVEDSE